MTTTVGPPNLRWPVVGLEVFTPVNAIVGLIDLVLTEDTGNDKWINIIRRAAGYVYDMLVYCPNLTIEARLRLFDIAQAGDQFAQAASLNVRQELRDRCMAAHESLRALSQADRLLFYRRESIERFDEKQACH